MNRLDNAVTMANAKDLLNFMEDTQERAVLKYMCDYGVITSYDAFSQLGITRLSARIYNLRHNYNIPIECENITKKKGKRSVTYGAYRLGQ